ncbi:translin-associated factor X-interacting protein 1-like [Gigantopelta aegis]|uniref:translin-associated factor X-interacting protein 1-like n=1 Tax=Gigantopelta aegis TaxID=1735272 RepID=UPI001B888C94|nr:translin-associated factor X-interacting protein 1-like [Gigantopelta aegis]
MAAARLPPLSGGNMVAVGPQFDGMLGTMYRLDDQHHPLPPPRSLKPYVDTKAGELEIWPSHASGQDVPTTSAMLTKSKGLVLISDEEMGKPQLIPKPRFLEQLESFVKKELRALNVMEVKPSELRLQAYREVFEYLIENFKTYRSLLAAIKNEYEMMLAYQRQQIRELEPLRQMLVTVSEQCDQKIMALRDEEKKEILDLRQAIKKQSQEMSAMHNEKLDLQKQVERLQDELEELYHQYRNECDARKLLITDINDLRYQQEDYLMSKQNQQDTQTAADDPVIMKTALKKAREDEKAATQRLNEMIANYGDVIPRRDFEAVETKCKQLDEKYLQVQGDFKKLHAEHEALLDVNKQVTQQRDQFYVELETLKRSSTPRPDWDKCADYISGGIVHWRQLAENKSSNELVDVLLTEIGSGGIVDSGGADYFDALGTGDDVPVYLRYEGQVRNRKLGKRDCALLIRDIWREKGAHDAQKADGIRENMADFLHMYLKRRFALDQMVVEWGYNLEDACKRYENDENIGQFYGILTGKIDEETFHAQIQRVQQLITALTKADADHGNLGKLPRDIFKKTLEEFFEGISEEGLLTFVNAAEVELDAKESQEFEYKNLFMEDDEGKCTSFLEAVYKYWKEQKQKYVDDIKQQLEDTNPVSVDDLRRAIMLVDPEISDTQVAGYLSWVYQTPTDKIFDADPLDVAVVVERLLNGNVLRVGKHT